MESMLSSLKFFKHVVASQKTLTHRHRHTHTQIVVSCNIYQTQEFVSHLISCRIPVKCRCDLFRDLAARIDLYHEASRLPLGDLT